MKNFVFCFFFLFFGWALTAQDNSQNALAQQSTEKLTQLYGLDDEQQSGMLKIQERKYRNLAEIEPIKNTDPTLYIQKIRALQYANDKSIEKLLTEEQLKTLRRQQLALREEKALAYKSLREAGATQQEIDNKIIELDLKAIQ